MIWSNRCLPRSGEKRRDQRQLRSKIHDLIGHIALSEIKNMRLRDIVIWFGCLFVVATAVGQEKIPSKPGTKMPWDMTADELLRATAASDSRPTLHVDHDFHFSLRCSKGPRDGSVGSFKATFDDFLYLKWSGRELSHKKYSTSVDRPQTWYPDEDIALYSSTAAGGKAQVSSDHTQLTRLPTKRDRIEVILRNSDDNDLAVLVGDPISEGRWIIEVNDNSVASVDETTVTYVKGKLSSSASTRWDQCRLMTDTGRDMLF